MAHAFLGLDNRGDAYWWGFSHGTVALGTAGRVIVGTYALVLKLRPMLTRRRRYAAACTVRIEQVAITQMCNLGHFYIRFPRRWPIAVGPWSEVLKQSGPGSTCGCTPIPSGFELCWSYFLMWAAALTVDALLAADVCSGLVTTN